MSVNEFKDLPGFKEEHVEQLAAIGITSVDELKAAVADEEKSKEIIKALTGVGPKTVESWKDAFEGGKTAKAEAATEIVEAGVYTPSIKPELDEATVNALALRAIKSGQRPAFKRQEWYRYKMLGEEWRRPRGIHSKMRRGFKRRPPMVEIGYRGPKSVRGLHPSGFEEVMVYNADSLDKIDPKAQAIRIGGTVGVKKRLVIEARAAELGIRVLNKLQRKV
jgi:large subunit ribosomal protein L32e